MKLDQAKTRPLSSELENQKVASKRVSLMGEGSRSEIVYLDVNFLVPYRHQARRNFDEQELQALANTVKEHGIRQPLTVLKSETEDGFFEVISGERRLRAAKIVSLKKVPCIILASRDQAEEIALVENIQRQDLHPIELARALKALVDKLGWGGQTELEKKIGLSPSQISELLKLNELSLVVQEECLKKNFRGRDNLRALFQLKSDNERLKAIEQTSNDKNPKAIKKSFSVLRLSYDHEDLKVQRQAIAKLSVEQKEQVRAVLEDILHELW